MTYYGYYRGRKLRKQRNREINRGLIALFPRTVAAFGMGIGAVMLVAGLGAGIGGVVFALAILVPSVVLFVWGQTERNRRR